MASTNLLSQKVAAALRAEMGAQMKTVSQMAEALDLDRKATKLRYDGKRDLTLSEVDTLADWLGVDVDYLLRGQRLAVAS
jgi:plasmid maintenance system antidote protein VapI